MISARMTTLPIVAVNYIASRPAGRRCFDH